jgi:hypothetical protein
LSTFDAVSVEKSHRCAFLHKRWLHVGAADEARTRYLHLGKVALYQMSYGRRFHCGAPGVPGDVDYYTAAFASCQLQICIF